jgi:hypothetical protein
METGGDLWESPSADSPALQRWKRRGVDLVETYYSAAPIRRSPGWNAPWPERGRRQMGTVLRGRARLMIQRSSTASPGFRKTCPTLETIFPGSRKRRRKTSAVLRGSPERCSKPSTVSPGSPPTDPTTLAGFASSTETCPTVPALCPGSPKTGPGASTHPPGSGKRRRETSPALSRSPETRPLGGNFRPRAGKRPGAYGGVVGWD